MDAEFSRRWAAENSLELNSILSRTGCAMFLFSHPLFCQSDVQIEFSLPLTETECMSLSQCLRNDMPLINLANKLGEAFDFQLDAPEVKCALYEDNQITIEVAKSPKILLLEKHISLKHHHFMYHAQDGCASIQCVPAEHQIGDTFTKPLLSSSLKCLRKKLIGW